MRFLWAAQRLACYGLATAAAAAVRPAITVLAAVAAINRDEPAGCAAVIGEVGTAGHAAAGAGVLRVLVLGAV